jgi:hypothetical protein
LKTVRLLFWTGVAYAVLLALVTGFFASTSASALPLTGIPLILITLIIVRDLTRRSTVGSTESPTRSETALKVDPVRFLSSQIKGAADASDSYFDDIVRSRLVELLINKVTVETGLDKETVRRTLSNSRTGPALLGDPTLHRILYGPVPEGGRKRIETVQNALELIGAWKG